MRGQPTATRTTPLDPLRAAAAIEDAFDREEIFELVLRGVRARLGFAALLTVHHDGLRGWRVLAGDGFDTRGVDTLQLSRNVPAFEAAIATTSASIGSIATREPFVDGLLELLGGRSRCVLVAPVTVRMHPLALVVAHGGDAVFTRADVAELFPLIAAADAALARVMSTRARSAAERAPSRADSAEYEYEIEVSEQAGPTARRAMLAAQRAAAAWPELAQTIRELVRDGVDHGDPGEDEQLELLLELGRIEADHLGRPEAAIEAWRGARAIDGADERALDALEALFARQGRWQDCVELVEKRVALIDDRAQRITMLLNLAAIAREHLGDPGRAIEAYERIVQWEPGHPRASAQLEELYRARQEWQPLAAQLLDRASREGDPAASIAALESVADIYEHQVGDARAALLVWLTVLRRDPDRPRLAAGRRGSIDEVERLAPAANAWEEIGAETAAAAEDLEPNHPRVAAALWQLVGRWSRDRIADRDGAIRALERAVRLGPGDPVRESELHAELGELHEADPARAVEHYEHALIGRPEELPVLVALHRLYRAREAWGPLAGILPRLIDALAPSAQVAVIVELDVELGTLLAERLGRPESAVGAFQDALALDPKHAAAFHGLAQVYEATGQTEALLEAREAELDVAEPAERARRYGDIAAAWHEHRRFDRAAACWHKLLALEPHSAVAQQGLARTLREDLQWLELASVLRAQIALTPGAPDRLGLLELAELLETRLDDVEGATAALEQVIAVHPDDPAALDALARLHDRTGRLRPALDALERLLAVTTDPHARADLLQRVGQVHLAARDAAAARLSLVQSLALDRDNARAREAMARVHLQQGELVAAGEELRRAARLSVSRDDTLRCLADAAWLYRHRLGDTERARECLQRILELDPEHADAKQALAELLHDTHEWAGLWPHLEAQVARARDDAELSPAERHELFTKAARCAVELGKFGPAMELYDLACGIAPGPATLIERAEAQYRSKALDAAALSYQTIATDSAALDRAQRIVVYRRLAQIQTELGKASQAQLFHGKVLDLDPGHRETHTELAELHLAGGRYDDAIASLRALVAIAPPAERPGLLERIGDLYAHQLANPARATSTYLDALELDGGNRRILQRLLDLQSAAGQWTRAVDTIGKFLAHETDRARRAAYHLAAAEIRRTELRDTRGALDDYERALDELLAEQPLRPATRQRAIEVFHEVDALVTAERDWKLLEQAYHHMIKRVPAGDPMPDPAVARARRAVPLTPRAGGERDPGVRGRARARSRQGAAAGPHPCRALRADRRVASGARRDAARACRERGFRGIPGAGAGQPRRRPDRRGVVCRARARGPQARELRRGAPVPEVPGPRDAQGQRHPRRGRMGARAPPGRGSGDQRDLRADLGEPRRPARGLSEELRAAAQGSDADRGRPPRRREDLPPRRAAPQRRAPRRLRAAAPAGQPVARELRREGPARPRGDRRPRHDDRVPRDGDRRRRRSDARAAPPELLPQAHALDGRGARGRALSRRAPRRAQGRSPRARTVDQRVRAGDQAAPVAAARRDAARAGRSAPGAPGPHALATRGRCRGPARGPARRGRARGRGADDHARRASPDPAGPRADRVLGLAGVPRGAAASRGRGRDGLARIGPARLRRCTYIAPVIGPPGGSGNAPIIRTCRGPGNTGRRRLAWALTRSSTCSRRGGWRSSTWRAR